MADKRKKSSIPFTHLCQELVIMIISFLSLPDAMNLCSLHQSWYNLWSHCRIIELDETSFPDGDAIHKALAEGDEELALHMKVVRRNRFIEYIKWVVSHLEAPCLFKFSLRVCCEPQYYKLIEDWIGFAMVRNVEELNLEFSEGMFTIPKFFYSLGGSIKFLNLNSCYLGEFHFESFISLTKVAFTCIEISVMDVKNLVTSCPLLEDFSLVQCTGLFTLRLKHSCMKLKRLVVKNCEPLSLGIVLHVPNLQYFEYAGGLIRFDLRELDSIEEAILDYGVETYFHYQALEIKQLITGFKQARILRLCSYVHQVLPSEYHFFHEPPLQLKNLVHLTLKTCVEGYELPGIICLLACAPNLRNLSIMSGFMRTLRDFLYFVPTIPDGFWQLPKWPLKCLEMVEMVAFSANNYEMHLLKFLLRNGVVLQKVIIKPKEASSSIFQALLGLQNAQKASGTVQIAYEFVLKLFPSWIWYYAK